MCARAIVYFIETIRWPLLDVQPAHGTKVKVLLNEIIRLCLSGWLITISSISRQIRNDTNTNGLLFDLPNYSAVFSIFPQNNWFVRVCANLHKYSTNKRKVSRKNLCKCVRLYHRKYTHAHVDHVCGAVNSSRKNKTKSENKSDKNATMITLLLFSRHIVRLFSLLLFFTATAA